MCREYQQFACPLHSAVGTNYLKGRLRSHPDVASPIRREFHWGVLLSGSRPDALKRAKIEHVDFRARISHVPKPNGGETKAFDIPLSRSMIRCLVRIMRLGRVLYPTQAQDWLFPADSAAATWWNIRKTVRRLASGAMSFGKPTEPWRKLRGPLISISTCS